MLGRISEQKAPDLLIEALGRIDRLPPDIGLFIVGEEDDQAVVKRLQRGIEQYNLGNFVKWFPSTTEPQAFYHAADVTVLPSLWEGCPNVILESFAAGCPVIVSEAANMSGLVQHGVNGWVIPTGDVQSLSATLRIVAALSTTELRAMSSACQAVAAAFPVSRMVREYEELYERLSACS
jgi:glycosyltransferase involved in cell wall biosynthesis